MALSGAIQKNASWAYLRLEWSATQDKDANTSTITSKLYWGATYAIGSSATKDGSHYIDGTWQNFTTAGASLSAGQKKLIHTYTRTLTHSDDGKLNVTFDGWYSPEVTLSGTYVGTISLDAQSWDLDTIPRKSTMSDTTPTFTAGSDFTLNISPASSSFSHRAYIDMKDSAGAWQNIKYVDFAKGDASQSSSFTQAEKTEIFSCLAGASSRDIRINLHTYNSATIGTNSLGYNTYSTTGGVTSPNASTISGRTPAVSGDSQGVGVYIEDSITLSISRADTEFIHTLQIYAGSTLVKTISGVTTSTTFTFTDTEKNTIYDLMDTVKELDGKVMVTTYYDGTTDKIVKSATDNDINWHIKSGLPTFDATHISYDDSDTTVAGITGNNKYIVQSKSSLRVYLTKLATPFRGTTMKEYKISVGGKTDVLTAVGNKILGTFPNLTSNTTLTVTAVDNRGFEKSASMTVLVVPYSPPTIVISAKRQNGFNDATDISVSGSIAELNIAGTKKNALTVYQYQYKENPSGAYNAYTSFASASGVPSYTTATYTATLNKLSAWTVQVKIKDKFDEVTATRVVAIGQPLMFMDANKKSVGVNTIPSYSNTFEVMGDIYHNGRPFATESQQTVVVASANWYRIAETNSGIGNTIQDFEMIWALSGSHSATKLTAGISYSDNSDSVIIQSLGHTYWSGGITKARIVYDDATYSGVKYYLEVYVGTAGTYTVTTKTLGGFGWNLLSIPVVGSIPTNYTSKEIDLKEGAGGLVGRKASFQYLLIDTSSDISLTATEKVGLQIGSGTGLNIKIDQNEIIASNNGVAQPLHLNTEGSYVTINNNSKYDGTYGLIMYNALKIYGNGGATAELHGVDHGYIEYFTNGYDGSRTAYVGFGSATSNSFSITNNLGDGNIVLAPNNGSGSQVFWFDKSTNAGMNYGVTKVKLLYSTTQIQSRNTGDTAYGSFGGSDFIVSSKREWKKNIEPSSDVLDKVRATTVYDYNLDDDLNEWDNTDRSNPYVKRRKDPSEVKKRKGLILEEAPDELREEEGITLYAMNAMLWKAVQELSDRVDAVNEKIKRR